MAWLWRRKDRDAAPPRPEAAPAPSAGDDVIRQEQAPTGDWMTLPPMATNGPIPTTFRVQTLPEILTTHQSPRLSGSLGHAVSPQAPSGIVSGLAMEAASVRPTESGTDLPLRAPHAAPVEDEAISMERPVQERSLPAVQPEPLAISRLPEPVVSRSLGEPLPLVSPVSGARDLPVARTVDAPVAPRPAAPASAPSAGEPGPGRDDASASAPGPDAPVAAPDLRVGGFDHSALDDLSQGGDSELLAPAPDDLGPPIQPRTLQRRLAGARPIEVPPQLRLPSSAATADAPAPGSTGMDLPLVTPPSAAGSAAGGDVAPPAITAQRSADAGMPDAAEPAQPVEDEGAEPVETTAETLGAGADTEATDITDISAQRTADTSGALPLHTPAQATPGVGSASDQPGRERSGISAQRTHDTVDTGTEDTGTEETVQRTADTLGTAAVTAAAAEPTDIAAQRTADTATPLPLHIPTQPTPGVGSASEQPGPERSGISAQRTEDSGTEDTGTEANVQRTADTLGTEIGTAAATEATDIAAQRTAETSSALPLHTPAQPTPGVGSASEQPGRERSGISAQRTEDTGTEDTGTENTVPTVAPLTTTASSDHLTAAGSTTQEQVGAPASSLPLAPADWQETLDAPSGGGPVAPAEGGHHSAALQPQPAVQTRPEHFSRAPAGAGAAPSLPLVASRPVGTHQPLSSLAPMMPGTTSVAQRTAAAGPAATAPAATLIRPRPAVAGSSLAMPHLPDIVTRDVLSAPLAPAAPMVTPSTAPAPGDGGDSTNGLPLQRSVSAPGATGPASTGATRQALPLHTPAAAIPSAADIAVTAGLAERGPGGSLRYTHLPAGAEPPPGAEASIQRTMGSATDTPAPATTTGGGNEITSAGPAPGPPDATLQERAQALAEQARKLYPHIRHQLESDIRRQLEARSRAGGTR